VSEDRGFCVWFTGLSGAGKSTIAELLVPALRERGLKVELLDGDVVRMNLSKGLGFSKEDRDANILRIGFVANLLVRNGVVTVCSAISPYREIRDRNRELIGDFVEVYVEASLEEVTRRDVKGLYEKAIAGEILNFTGVSDPYEAPETPELAIDTERCSPAEACVMVIEKLAELGYLKENQPATT